MTQEKKPVRTAEVVPLIVPLPPPAPPDPPSPEELDDNELMRRVALRECEALERLHARHSEKLFRFVRNYTRDKSSAQDVCQATWLRVFQAAARYNPGNFPAWLLQIGRNLAIDLSNFSRRMSGPDPEQMDFLVDPGWNASTDAELQEERLTALSECIQSVLNPTQRVLVLARLADNSYDDIVRVALNEPSHVLHGRNANNLYGLMNQAKLALQTCIEGKLS